MRVKCLSQEHNTMTRPGLEPGPFSTLTTRPPRLPFRTLLLQILAQDRSIEIFFVRFELYCYKSRLIKFLFTSALGIFDQAFAKTLLKSGFFGKLTTSVKDAWKAKYQKNVEEYFKQSILQNIATPVTQMIR